MIKAINFITLAISACLFSSLSICSWAGSDAIIEEIVVTTQYKKESSQSLAISSAIKTAADIEKLDVHSNSSLAAVTPGLSHAEFASGQSYLAIRGILSIDDGPGMDNSVVVFLDGVYIGRLSNVDFDLLDIERIEVLRGPQGTLFGRNAIGGAINIISKQAHEAFELQTKASLGNFDIRRYQALINGALNQHLSGRLSISHREHSGFSRNILLNEDNQTEDTNSLRAQLAYRKAHQEWLLSYDYTEDKRADMGRFPVEESGLGSLARWQSLGGDTGKTTAPISGFSDRSAHGIHLKGQIDFQNGSLHSITAWRKSHSNWAMATTGAPLAVNPPFPAMDLENGIYGSDINDLINEDIDQRSAEIRWLSTLNNSIHLSTGIFLLDENSKRNEQYQLVQNSIQQGHELVGNEITQQENRTKSIAAYSQLQWQIHEKWQSIFGVRWTRDSKNTRSTSLNCGQSHPLTDSSPFCSVRSGAFLNLLSSVFEVEAEQSWQDFSPKASIQYAPINDVMLYSSIAKGFKSGGFPGSPGAEQIATTPVAPEKAWNYELGFKSDWLDQTLRVNGSLFYTDYKNLQIVRFGPSPANPNFGSFTTTNIGRAEISGIELESQWIASSRLKFSMSYGYLHSEINDLLLETTSGVIDASGSELRQAPENSYHISVDYQLHIPERLGQVQLFADYQYADSQLSDYINRDTLIDELSQSNARMSWLNAQANIEVSLWVKNIENTRRIAHAYTVAGGVFGVWSPPRTIGLSLKWSSL